MLILKCTSVIKFKIMRCRHMEKKNVLAAVERRAEINAPPASCRPTVPSVAQSKTADSLVFSAIIELLHIFERSFRG